MKLYSLRYQVGIKAYFPRKIKWDSLIFSTVVHGWKHITGSHEISWWVVNSEGCGSKGGAGWDDQ